ncbi:hypothetical protein [Aureimonas sp. AU4]|uniref:hypothetical protein n=1 Tax=Aureimonas sp. AU4 TaxID=1638163 RepID=UPI0007849330|nr:hypothetical protein [Aureimonas sp. AU4]
MTDERADAGNGGRRADEALRHLLCALVALISFAVSTPMPLRLPHPQAADLRRASFVQLDDDEERELLLALLEEDEGDDDWDDAAV